MHKTLALIFLVTSLASISYAEVYKTIDEHGNPVFSDQPQPDAQPVEIKQTNTVKPIELAAPRPDTKPQKPNTIYSHFAITSPRDGGHIGNGLSPFNVTLSVQPKLLQGHKIQLFINGQLHSSGSGLSRQVASIERGEHSLSATIIDPKGKVIISSAPVKLTAQRPSLLNPNRSN
ncbi:DUF4124 domain-containing protein [Dasania sp. GY-MA-18]|uniref:DUF4124 domain-containing protein n=1 Tax=Dasania phycosphaerae TaxID=2950436 RepID=A0A9J6RNA8_9GAMM|nr:MULTISPECIES: DUF4124 domain-containing protein [Dasania]MCR8923061.1 DUF4124 domain-containing protein [Dasania sp. GY-MA-18]MCZ0865493.1 DUF4124 domain-containing protein [Dasania phycosphaerae]MCZ0869218.1 DUF4124 domain-containing protein [Dasania phycosphaerae]